VGDDVIRHAQVGVVDPAEDEPTGSTAELLDEPVEPIDPYED
jgi:hypothetical protein